MIFNNHTSVYILNMIGIRHSEMHQRTLSWRHVQLVKIKFGHGKNRDFNRVTGANYEWSLFSNMIRTTSWHAYHKPNVCLFLQNSHQRETKKCSFNHYYQHRAIKYIPAIALVATKIKTLYQFHGVTAIDFNFDNKWSHWATTSACLQH